MNDRRAGPPPGFQVGRDGTLWSTRALDDLIQEFYTSTGQARDVDARRAWSWRDRILALLSGDQGGE